ncbi:MAG: arginase [Bacilli bacterium]
MQYTFINANIDLGTHVDGSNNGPIQITNNFNSYKIVNIDQDNIIKDKNIKSKTKNLKSINKFNNELYHTVTDIIKNNEFPITIGGDHSLAIGSAIASNTQNEDIGIIWIDAHTDYNTIESTITGNVHGLPLAAINGHNKLELSSFLTPKPKYINHNRTVIVGARSIDELELVNLNKDNITVYTTEDIHKYGVDIILDKAFKQVLGDNNKVHISYDLDVIDPVICPGVSIPEVNGISLEESYSIMNYIATKKEYIKSLDLVEYNPHYDIDNKSLNIAIDLINIFLNNN